MVYLLQILDSGDIEFDVGFGFVEIPAWEHVEEAHDAQHCGSVEEYRVESRS